MKKLNAKRLLAFALALTMCAGAVGCGSKSEEDKIEEQLDGMTEEEFNEIAEELEKEKTTTQKESEAAAEEVPAEAEPASTAVAYYDLLSAEYEANGISKEESLFSNQSFLGKKNIEDPETGNSVAFKLYGDQIIYARTREYDENAGDDVVYPLNNSVVTEAGMKYAEEHTMSGLITKTVDDILKEYKEYHEEEYEQTWDIYMIDLYSYNITTKENTKLSTIAFKSNTAQVGSVGFESAFTYAGGYTFITNIGGTVYSNAYTRVSPDGTVKIFADDITALDGEITDNYDLTSGLSDGSAVLTSKDQDQNYKYALLDSDFSSASVLPAPTKLNEHGTVSTVEWSGSGAVAYGDKIYVPKLGVYYDKTSGEWVTVSEEERTGHYQVVGKYVLAETYLLDMETGEYIIDDESLQLIGRSGKNDKTHDDFYYGSDHVMRVYIHNKTIAAAQVAADSTGTGMEEQELATEWDSEKNLIISYKNYILGDEYGFFLRNFEDDSEDAILTF